MINGNELKRKDFDHNLGLFDKVNLQGAVLGADILGNNCSWLLMGMHAESKITFTPKSLENMDKSFLKFSAAMNTPWRPQGCEGGALRIGGDKRRKL